MMPPNLFDFKIITRNQTKFKLKNDNYFNNFTPKKKKKKRKKKLTFPAAGAGQISVADKLIPASAPMRQLRITRGPKLRAVSIYMTRTTAAPRKPPAELQRLNFQRDSSGGVAVERLRWNRGEKVVAVGGGEVFEIQETGGGGSGGGGVLGVAANTCAINRAIGRGFEFGLNHRRR